MRAPSGSPTPALTVKAGLEGGLLGGVVIWIYEAVVWVGVEHKMPLVGIARNATGLVFGKTFQEALGSLAYLLGIAIHFGFALVWGVLFAVAWPGLRRRGWEASLAGLLLAPVLWVVMHVAIAIAGHEHPDYLDPAIIIGGIFSHIFYSVPMALWIRRRMA